MLKCASYLHLAPAHGRRLLAELPENLKPSRRGAVRAQRNLPPLQAIWSKRRETRGRGMSGGGARGARGRWRGGSRRAEASSPAASSRAAPPPPPPPPAEEWCEQPSTGGVRGIPAHGGGGVERRRRRRRAWGRRVRSGVGGSRAAARRRPPAEEGEGERRRGGETWLVAHTSVTPLCRSRICG